MSLTTEKLQIESKIEALNKERTVKELEADMHIQDIREEASPLLPVLEIGVAKLDIALNGLKNCINRIQEIGTEIKKLERLL